MEVLTFRKLVFSTCLLFLCQSAVAQDAHALLRELSPIIQNIKKDLNSDRELTSVRNLLDALERSPNPRQATLLLQEIGRSEGLLSKFYEELSVRVHAEPERLERIRVALESVKNQIRQSNIVFPSFSRTWAGFGTLLASNDYLFSNYATVSQLYTPDIGFYTMLTKSMFAITLVNMGVAGLADAIVLKKSVGTLIAEFRERVRSKALTAELLNMVQVRAAGERQVKDAMGQTKGSEFGMENLASQLTQLLDIQDRSAAAKLGNLQIIQKLQRYLAQKRMHKVLSQVAGKITPLEMELLNGHLKDRGRDLEFKPNPKILEAQRSLYSDFIAWASAHPDNSIRDLISESVEAEKTLNNSRIVKLKPHWIAAFNYFIIGFSLTLASNAATVGIMELPFDNFVSTFLRTHRESISFYAGLTGILTYAVHLLSYPKIRKAEKMVTDLTLQPLKTMDRSAWEFFRRTATLAQLDYEIARPEVLANEWSKENAWSAVRNILKNHDLSSLEMDSSNPICNQLNPF